VAADVTGRVGRGAKARRLTDGDRGASRADPLLESKLFVPPPASSVVERPRLLARLAEGLYRHWRWSPPGWGKTTLLSTWVASPSAPALPWISLDAGDNDPARFWTYVSLALQQACRGVGDTSLTLLPSHQPATAEATDTRSAELREGDQTACFPTKT
jgi:ATP/maltotriose-dependent transcriptional regulator MalT